MRIKRWIAGLLCICMLGTTDAMTLHAASLGSMSTQEEESSGAESNQKDTVQKEISQEETTQDDVTQDNVMQDDAVQEESDSAEQDEVTEQGEVLEDEEQNLKETNEEVEKEEQTSPLISYAVIDQPYITTPGTQRIVVGIGEDTTVIERAVLTYKNRTTGEEMKVEAEQISGNAALFTMEFADESKSGIYELSSVAYMVAQIEYTTAFVDAGMEMVFGVNEQAESNPDGVVVEEEEIDVDVVTIDENGNTTSQNNIQEAIEEVQQDSNSLSKVTRNYGVTNGNIVVVLDPGHDANHPGAAYNGLVEKDINLKIAQYCKKELETYAGVSVYMTRAGDACAFGESVASNCNLKRVEYAKSVGADIYVSIHNNASGVNATGAEVYYPNLNYNAQVSAIGQATAQKILDKLAELGLNKRGVKIRNSEDGTRYPDGSLADYYGVIKNCKYAGIPAIIVEHAFMDSSDAANFLNSDEKLQRLGIADATGIAQHFGLKKKSAVSKPIAPTITGVRSVRDSWLKIYWKQMENVSEFVVYRSTKKDSGYSKIAIVENGDAKSYVDKSVEKGKTYYYKVKALAISDSKKLYSEASSARAGRTVVSTTISHVKSVGNTSLKIRWKKNAKANGYYLYRSTKKSGGYERIAIINSKDTVTYTDKDVVVGKTYYYKIKCRNKVSGTIGYSSASKMRAGRTVESTAIRGVKSIGDTKLKVSWRENTKANGYYLYRSTKKSGGYKKIAILPSKTTITYTDEDVKAGKTYYYKIRCRNKVSGITGYSSISSARAGRTVKATTMNSVKIVGNAKLKVSWKKNAKANGYYLYRSTKKSGGYKRIAIIKSKDTVSYTDKDIKSGETYYYKIKCRNKVNGIIGYSNASEVVSGKIDLEPIMGASTVTLQQMVAYYNRSGKTYPSAIYSSKGAPDIKTFCNIIMQEASAEGVRADLVFVQVCKETGFLQFGGDVQASQCNFAGLGATGNGVPGETFVDVRTGIRAQVQHLKAYASTQPLNQSCVDNRFAYVARGCAPYIEWLGIQENPNGKGWAAAPNYGYDLVNMIKTLKTM